MVEENRDAVGFLLAAAIRDVGFYLDEGAKVPGDAIVRSAAIRAHLPGHPLISPLITLAQIASDFAEPGPMTGAVLEIKQWAEARGLRATAREFSQLAARLDPDNLDFALDAARLSRDTGELPVAESWFRRVISRARATADWSSYVWGYIGLGVLYHRAGNHPASVVVFDRARRAALRHRLQSAAGSAHHHLFALAAEAGRFADVYPHLELAARLYGPRSERLPSLAHDAARFWIDLGRFDRALPVLETVWPLLQPRINDYTLCRANLAWAAAGTNDRRKYEVYEEAALEAIRRKPTDDIAATAYLHLAYALELLSDVRAAISFAHTALDLSTRAGSMYVREKTHALLERLVRAEAPHAVREQRAEPPNVAGRGQRLAEELVGALQ